MKPQLLKLMELASDFTSILKKIKLSNCDIDS